MSPLVRITTVLLVSAALTSAGSQSQSGAPSETAWPFDLDTLIPTMGLSGEAIVRVTTSGRAVSHAEVLSSTGEGILAQVALRTIKQWRIDPSLGASFDIALRHVTTRVSCGEEGGQIVRVAWPRSVEVETRVPPICDPTARTTTLDSPLRILVGTVRCECPGNATVPGVEVSVVRQASSQTRLRRVVRTDSDGVFRLTSLPAGRYSVTVAHPDFMLREYEVEIMPQGADAPLRVVLERTPVRQPVPLVRGGSIPAYPLAALAKRVQGEVVLRTSFEGDRVLDVNVESEHDELSRAAVSNLRTWRIQSRNAPVLTTRYVYRLVPGDCTKATARIVLRLPALVEVEAITPCLSN